MNTVGRQRFWSMPIAMGVAGAMIAAPLLSSTPGPTPHALALGLSERSEHAAVALTAAVNDLGERFAERVEQAGVTAVTVLSQAPAVLARTSTHELASFVALPGVTTPLTAAPSGGGAAESSSAAPAGLVRSLAVAAAEPSALAGLLSNLELAVGRLVSSFADVPGYASQALNGLLTGHLKPIIESGVNAVLTPLLGLVGGDLPNITASLSKLVPPLAPLFDAVPNIVLNDVGFPVALGVVNFLSGIGDTYESVRSSLLAGDLGGAVNGLVTGVVGIVKNGNSDLARTVSGFGKAGADLLKAIGQVISGAGSTLAKTASSTTPATPATDAKTSAVALRAAGVDDAARDAEKPGKGGADAEKPVKSGAVGDEPVQAKKPDKAGGEAETPVKGAAEAEKPGKGAAKPEKPAKGGAVGEKPVQAEKPGKGAAEAAKPGKGGADAEKTAKPAHAHQPAKQGHDAKVGAR